MSVTPIDGTSTRGGAGVNWAKDDHGVCFVATAGGWVAGPLHRSSAPRPAMKRLISLLARRLGWSRSVSNAATVSVIEAAAR